LNYLVDLADLVGLLVLVEHRSLFPFVDIVADIVFGMIVDCIDWYFHIGLIPDIALHNLPVAFDTVVAIAAVVEDNLVGIDYRIVGFGHIELDHFGHIQFGLDHIVRCLRCRSRSESPDCIDSCLVRMCYNQPIVAGFVAAVGMDCTYLMRIVPRCNMPATNNRSQKLESGSFFFFFLLSNNGSV
jgi:hypothetical protein